MKNHEAYLSAVESAIAAMRRAKIDAHLDLSDGLQLSRTQLEILVMLSDHAITTTGDLAQALYLSQSAVTQTVDTLVRRDLIERRPDEADRRVIQLRLTPAGQDVTQQIRERRRRHLAELLDNLTEAEIQALITIAGKLTLLLERETKTNA